MNEISSETLLGTDKDDDVEEVVDWGDCCLYDASVDGFANDVVSSVMMAFVVGTPNNNALDAPPAAVTICGMTTLLDLGTHSSSPAPLAADNAERC